MFFVVFLCFLQLFTLHHAFGTYTTCIHGGTKYKDGDYFPPNDTIIQTESPQQCVQCRCHQGLVVCEIENCSPINCEKPINHPQYCCQKCPDLLKTTEKPLGFIFSDYSTNTNSQDKHKHECVSNGKRHENGSIWQPVIGPFGIMACVQCVCQEGNVICSRLRCKDLPCSHPRREFGQCCPVCPNSELREKLLAHCLPENSEVFVFKTPNLNNNSIIIEYGFLDNEDEENSAKIHTWNIQNTRSTDVLTVNTIYRKDFYKKDWKILGSTSRKRYKKYLKREKRLRGNCLMKCLEKIRRLENSLGIYPAATRSKCNEGEINASDI